jgi:hypothetical protein
MDCSTVFVRKRLMLNSSVPGHPDWANMHQID